MTVSEDAVPSRILVTGWVLKGSEVVSGLACWRFGVLEGSKFLSYRSETDEQPSSEWQLVPGCDITKLEPRDIHVKAKGKSTFVALVAGRYGKIEGHQFSVLWPQSNQSRSVKGNRLILGFELETDAARWQTAFLKSREDLDIAQQEATASSPPPLPMDSPPHPSREIKETKEPDLINLDDFMTSKGNPSPPLQVPSNQQMNTQTLFYDANPIVRSNSFSSSLGGVEPSPDSSLRNRSVGFWSPWKHVNGVAIYKEEDPSEGVEAFMVSCAIRSPPSVCFQALMAGNIDKSMTRGSSDFLSMDIIDKLDEDVDVVHGYLAPRGWISSLLAQRYIVLERNWRKEEEDGNYVVVLKSSDRFVTDSVNVNCVNHQTVGQWLWNPIRAQVLASVFTIAPLKEKYYPLNCSESPEALVTMVLKIDLGGMLSPVSLFHPMSHLMSIKDSWIESILMTVVSLRDRAEQSRFVCVPISIDSGSGLPLPASPMTGDPMVSSVCHWTEAEREDLSNLTNTTNTFQRNEETNTMRAASLAMSLDVEIPPEMRTTGTCNPAYWMCPGSAGYRVRGATYLTDKKKISATEPMFDLHSVDLVKVKQPTPHIARFLNSVQQCPSAFAFVLQIMVPGPPDLALVITWRSKDEGPGLESSSSLNLEQQQADVATEPEQEMLPFELALMRFVTGDDETRDSSFKLIPHIVKGSFIIRQSVGSTPVLLGKKLKQYYFRNQRYIEVDIDVGSSYTAATVVNMVSGVTKTLVVDLAIVLEGKSAAELPESLLGTVRLDRLDLATAVDLDTSESSSKSLQQSNHDEEQSGN
eukprot:g4439.t1